MDTHILRSINRETEDYESKFFSSNVSDKIHVGLKQHIPFFTFHRSPKVVLTLLEKMRYTTLITQHMRSKLLSELQIC